MSKAKTNGSQIVDPGKKSINAFLNFLNILYYN